MIELNENDNPLLSDVITTRDYKRRNSMIATTWKLHTAAVVIERNNKSHLEILEESFTKPCITTAAKNAFVHGRG